ncbi:hypothetical protein M501DRAFT_167951 [Patellaria atrata CBS 101060]|uniref:Rhodopsin domain-containing protein n=1 Tax=Patellaria atrata CBS 101060 TaxID=1346257 RepID=A0A9P4S9F0_9PEZI|nr:hypothetical protein M501DRAFT_167951 [Patellaria atrata CBS 101060]
MSSGGSGENKGSLIHRSSIILYVLAALFVLLRLYTRHFIVSKFGLDDLMIFVAIIIAAFQTALILILIQHGWGKHVSDLSVPDVNDTLFYRWMFMLAYFFTLWAVKMSILALYWRVASRMRTPLGTGIYCRVTIALTVVMTAHAISSILVEIFQCAPIMAAWDIEKELHCCIDVATFHTIQASTNAVTDIILLIFPIRIVYELQIPPKQKAALFFVFAVGIIPVVAGLVRLGEIVRSNPKHNEPWERQDINWKWAMVPLRSQVEVCLGIVTASLPSLNPLFKKLVSGLTGRGRSARSPYNSVRMRRQARPQRAHGLGHVGTETYAKSNATASIDRAESRERILETERRQSSEMSDLGIHKTRSEGESLRDIA